MNTTQKQMFQSQFNKTKVQNQDACMTLDERLFDATRLCSFAQQHNQITMGKVKDVISQYLNHTDVPVAPPEIACAPQEPARTIHPDNARSIALAKRLGATLRGPTQLPVPLHEARVDEWGQTAAEWKAWRSR